MPRTLKTIQGLAAKSDRGCAGEGEGGKSREKIKSTRGLKDGLCAWQDWQPAQEIEGNSVRRRIENPPLLARCRKQAAWKMRTGDALLALMQAINGA